MSELSRGLRIDHGYVQVRLQINGTPYCRNFGKDCTLARQLGEIHLSEKRKEILMGKAGIEPEIPSKLFCDVADIYFDIWSKETDPNGGQKHNQTACYNVRGWIDRQFKPYFGRMVYDRIGVLDAQKWRDARVKVVSGITANREQAVLSSIFSHIEMWVKSGKIKKPFKLPAENPCGHVEMAGRKKRERILTTYEISKLKLAFRTLNDQDGCDIFCLWLKTCASEKDLRRLRFGDVINLSRAKTGVPINLPITVTFTPNWVNWRKRWEAARAEAGIAGVEARDLRKTGINLLVGQFDMKLISQYASHANQKTTEAFYTVNEADKLQPLAKYLSDKIDSL